MTPKIKLSFIGTSSVGKTTLVNLLKEKHSSNPKIAFSREAGREYFEENPNTKNPLRQKVQKEIQELVIENEKIALLKNPEILICDRSVIDAAVYTLLGDDEMGAHELLMGVEGWIKTYNKFFLLDPMDVPFVKDGIRVEDDEEARNRVHDIFIEIMESNSIDYEILSGSVEERLSRVEEFLGI